MSDHGSETLWTRARPGAPLAWIGPAGRVPPAPEGWRTVRVRCDGPARPLEPLRQALARVEGMVGARVEGRERAARRIRGGLRRRFWGDEPAPHPGSALHAALVDLDRALLDTRVALVLEGVDDADADTRAFAARLAGGAPWPVAVILGLRPGSEAAAEDLLGPLRRADPPAVLHAEPPPVPVPDPGLPPDLPLRTLQAAAVVGPRFTTAQLAGVLDRDPVRLLEDLQVAADAGVPLEDLGRGAFRMPPGLVEALRERVLPSLAEAWQARLVAHAATAPEAGPDPAAVAPHLVALGREDEAVARLLEAAEAAGAAGAHRQALAHTAHALRALAAWPTGAERSALEARALLQAAIDSHALVGTTGPEASTLGDALALVDRAWATLPASAPATLQARIRVRAAAICADRGDPASLERALSELTAAVHLLHDAGEPRDAARLLNDQALVWVRLGDPLQAASLLDRSRSVFAALPDPTDADRAEVAESLHLLARLPLHVASRPGREVEALDQAADHAHDAWRIFDDLGLEREAARALETLGRLRIRQDRPADADRPLRQAAAAQERLGDALGLARTAGALSELLAGQGDLDSAGELLATSVELNRRVGCLLGLRHNREAIQALRETAPRLDGLADVVDSLLDELEA